MSHTLMLALLAMWLPGEPQEMKDVRIGPNGEIQFSSSSLSRDPLKANGIQALKIPVNDVEFLVTEVIAMELALDSEQLERLGKLSADVRDLKRRMLAKIGDIQNSDTSIQEIRDVEAGVRATVDAEIKATLTDTQEHRLEELKRQAQLFSMGAGAVRLPAFGELEFNEEQLARALQIQSSRLKELEREFARRRFEVYSAAIEEVLREKQRPAWRRLIGVVLPYFSTTEE